MPADDASESVTTDEYRLGLSPELPDSPERLLILRDEAKAVFDREEAVLRHLEFMRSELRRYQSAPKARKVDEEQRIMLLELDRSLAQIYGARDVATPFLDDYQDSPSQSELDKIRPALEYYFLGEEEQRRLPLRDRLDHTLTLLESQRSRAGRVYVETQKRLEALAAESRQTPTSPARFWRNSKQ